MNEKRLVRTSDNRMLFGVASGIARCVGSDPVIVRLALVLITLLGSGFPALVYVALMFVMPEEFAPAAKATILDEEEIIIKDAA